MVNKLGVIIIAICIYSASIQFILSSAEDAPDLYSEVDDVIRLNSITFIPTVFHQNKNITFMVQFYNTFCGHCQMFAPVYKELASRVKNWTSVVRVAGVDCSKDENMNTCSDNKVEGYPTIFIFPPNPLLQEPKDKPLNLRSLNIQWNVDEIEESLIDYVGNLTNTRNEYPLVADAFKPVEVTDAKSLYSNRLYLSLARQTDSTDPQTPQDLMFIVEPEESYLGRRLMLEYFRINSKLELRRILLSNQELLKNLLTEEEFGKLNDTQPLLIRITEQETYSRGGGKAQVLVKGEANHILPTSAEHEKVDFIYNKFKVFFEHFFSIELKEKDGEFEQNHFASKKVAKKLSNENQVDTKNDSETGIQYLLNNDPIGSKRVFAIDMIKGISYMITHEIQIKGDLSPDEFNTVRNLLTILKKYLPLEKWDPNLNKFILELRTRLDDQRVVFEKRGVTSQEMKDILLLSGSEALRLRYNHENYVSCYESDRQHKGYTCSLWLLFHSLTVGEYFKAAPVRFRPTMVLYTMRDYVTRFLGCTVCSSNFKKETESLETSLSSRNSSIIWLWYTHNRVNLRLNNERVSDKRSMIDAIFPSYKNCPLCLKGDISDVGRDGKSLEDVDWSLSDIFNYLTDLYRPDRIVTPVEMMSLLTNIRNKVNYELIYEKRVDSNSANRRLTTTGADFNSSGDRWNIQSIFSTSDISLCLFLYLACIMIVAIVCVALNPRWKRFKTK